MTNVEQYRACLNAHNLSAMCAYDLFVRYCGSRPCRAPGMDTVWRLAIRIGDGRTVEEAAAREYCYRWALAIQSPIFGAPHTLGL